MSFCSRAAELKVVIDIGTVCSLSERFCAVTTTSCNPPPCDVGCSSATAAPEAASHTLAIHTIRGSLTLMASPLPAALVAPRCGSGPAAPHRLCLPITAVRSGRRSGLVGFQRREQLVERVLKALAEFRADLALDAAVG